MRRNTPAQTRPDAASTRLTTGSAGPDLRNKRAAASDLTQAPAQRVVSRVLAWYRRHGRDLPWRRPDVTPWQVLVSEVMLQQTPVSRVLPVYAMWTARWPTPQSLAAATPADAVRAWGRLGYPRRALWLHQAARAIVDRFGGIVPDEPGVLATLPGIGRYTAAAVAAFAYRRRVAVLDTNVRRVLARFLTGVPHPTGTPRAAEYRSLDALLPKNADRAARFSVALMELGALICTSRSPGCARCPLTTDCAWHRAGRPAGTRRPRAPYTGSDRQARGALLAALREYPHPVSTADLARAWPDPTQRRRALASLVSDGLVSCAPGGRYQLGPATADAT
ncbi:MAG: A/G-specific adenine glycosylase [Acidothermus cellulolyticus]|nr:A/G-specific adenine glycosylase [Acidothermus cellulolyticus]